MKRKSGDGMRGKTSEEEGKAWGHGQYANMPQEVKMSQYEKYPHKNMSELDDTMNRIDEDERYNERGDRRSLERGMY